MQETYTIPESRVEEAQKRFAKVVKRAAKLGVTPPTLTLGELSKRERTHSPEGERYKTPRIEIVRAITIDAERIKLPGGWTLLGSIVPTSEGNMVMGVPGATIPALYRDRDGRTCDHCKVLRNRAETHLVQNESGTIAQVGSSCVSDFLGGHNAHDLVALLGWQRTLSELGDEFAGFGAGESVPSLSEVVTLSAYVIRSTGWMSATAAKSRSDVTATSYFVSMFLNASKWNEDERRRYTDNHGHVTDADRASADKAIAWIEAIAASDAPIDNDYIANLSVIAKLGAVRARFLGIAVSLVFAWNRAMEQEINRTRQAEKSKHVGTVKTRQDFTLKVVKSFVSSSRFGVTDRVEFVDGAGNVFVWWASSESGFTIGETVTVKATVKGHDTYKGIAQTVLTRVTVLLPAGV